MVEHIHPGLSSQLDVGACIFQDLFYDLMTLSFQMVSEMSTMILATSRSVSLVF